MATGHAQENQLAVMEERTLSAVSSGSGILVDDGPPRAILECHICMEAPTDPVATSCGHVFCWPCLSQWLQDSLRPCPICRKLLSRNANILSLHHGAGDDAAAARATASHGNDGAGEAVGGGNVMTPPRPANPQLFVPLAICRAVDELVRERSRGRRLSLERARLKPLLKRHTTELLRRTSALTQETSRMGEHIAELERRLALANQQPPSGRVE